MSKSGTTETALGKCRFEECSVSAKALGEPCTNSPATKNGKEILYQEHADTDLNCCELCRNKFNAKTSVHKMKLLIRPGYENGCCEMLGCTDKGVAHKYRVYPDYGPNIVACFDNNIAVPIHIFQAPQNEVIYIDCFQNDRPFCRTTDEKGWTCEIINDDPLDKNFYFNGTRLKVLTPDQNKKKHDAKTPPQENSLVGGPDHVPRLKLSTKAEEQEDPNVFDCSHPICDSGPLRLHTAEVNMCPSCVRSHTKDGYTDCVLHDDYLGGDSYSTIICAVCNESFSLRLKLTRYNYPITQLEPIGYTEWCDPRLKLSTKRKADEEATDTEDDSEQEDPNVLGISHKICDSGPLRLYTREVDMCPSCLRSHTYDGYTDSVLHDDFVAGNSYPIYCVSCNENYGTRLQLTRYNYPITQLEPIGNTEWCEPRLKLSTKRKADEEAMGTEDDSDRDTKRIKKSNLTRMNADSEMYGLLKCNVEAREKKQEECGTVGDIDLLHLCYGCKLDALKEKAFELVCIPFPLDDNEYKYYACEREGCRTAEVGCGNVVKRA